MWSLRLWTVSILQRYRITRRDSKLCCSTFRVIGQNHVVDHQIAKHGRPALGCHRPRTYICHFCSKPFNNRDNFVKHLKIHGTRNYLCDMCHAAFKTAGSLRRHRAAHSTIICGYCQQEFQFMRSFKAHHKNEHSKMLKMYQMVKRVGDEYHLISEEPELFDDKSDQKCRDCGKIITDIQQHNCQDVEIRECEKCKKKFRSKIGFERHKCAFEQVEYETMTCSICEKVYKSKKGFQDHKCKLDRDLKSFHVRGDAEIEFEVEVDVEDN